MAMRSILGNDIRSLPRSRTFLASASLLAAAAGFGAIGNACSSSDDPTPSVDAGGDTSPVSDGGSDEDGSAGGTDSGSDASGEDAGGDAGNDSGTDAGTAPLDISKVAQRTWTWFEIPGATCRDGSAAGISLNLNAPSKKTMIFLQGGGACFNAQTCQGNPAKVEGKDSSSGILDRTNAANPVADWNYVFVPYCTGDVFAGNNPNGTVPGVSGTQKFVGYANMEIFLSKIAATFPTTERVLLTGTSAGGFGAAANYGHALRIFPEATPVNLVDDSGPLMRQPPLAHCLQDLWKTMWNLDDTVLAECGQDCIGQQDFLLAASKHWATARPNLAQGLVSATGDQTIRNFYGFGAQSCTSFAQVTATDYAAGLQDIRTQLAGNTNVGSYLYDATSHTLLQSDALFYSTTLGSKSPAAWVKDIVDGAAITNVGP